MKISSFKTVEVKKVLVYCTKANEMRLTWERVQSKFLCLKLMEAGPHVFFYLFCDIYFIIYAAFITFYCLFLYTLLAVD